MRILHTSDWHLGRLFHGTSLLDEQERALARIVELVEHEGVDLVVVAGDLYDRSVPPADAVELLDRTLLQLHRSGAVVVAISGNHDSSVRVGFGERLVEGVGVSIRGDLRRCGEAVELVATDGPPVRVYPVPYLDPLATAHAAQRSREAEPDVDEVDRDGASGGTRSLSHHDAMAWAMRAVRADLAAAAAGTRSIVVAHTFVTGGDPSASERELTLGHVEQVGLSVFDGVDYVALGHLHRRQSFAGGRITYSGSPLRYSFSEEANRPSVELVELRADGSSVAERIELGAGRPMRTVRGELDALLGDPSLRDAEDAWVRAVLTDRQLPLQAMRRLQARFPHAVELTHEPAGRVDAAGTDPVRRLRDADPLALSVEFLRARRGLDLDESERALLAESVAAVVAGPGARP